LIATKAIAAGSTHLLALREHVHAGGQGVDQHLALAREADAEAATAAP
jgi:hypothetical protein